MTGMCRQRERPTGALTIEHDQDDAGTWVTADGNLEMANEGGYNGCGIRIRVLLDWLRTHRPDLLDGTGPIVLPGFRCKTCGAFTGTEKEDLTECRCCCTPKP